MDFQLNRPLIKWVIMTMAAIIALGSLAYTNILVKELAHREYHQIDLYAKGLGFVSNPKEGDDLSFMFTEIIEANNSIPVIWADEFGLPIESRNIDLPEKMTAKEKSDFLLKIIGEMKKEHPPVVVELGPDWKNYIYYQNSYLITKLKYYPYIQLTVIAIFSIMAYFIFSSSKNAEQNKVWVGLAKETAHQLGTPLSSLVAWVEYFKLDPEFDTAVLEEIEKDIQRLEMITARFSSIGSAPTLSEQNIHLVVSNIVDYLEKRVSQKVSFDIEVQDGKELSAPINAALFEWVIENICKNAVDAMAGSGKIKITIGHDEAGENISIEIADNGKGMSKKQAQRVFQAGFTTKKRGWGLGLTLVKRIVESYHKGKIWVSRAVPDEGASFSILIPKKQKEPRKPNKQDNEKDTFTNSLGI